MGHDKVPHRLHIRVQNLAATFPVGQFGKLGRHGRFPADGLLHRSAELGRMGCGQADHGSLLPAGHGRPDADRRVGIEQISVFLVKLGNGGNGLVFRNRVGTEIFGRTRPEA